MSIEPRNEQQMLGPLFPLHHVWPMGFSRSSYTAQEEMLSVCQEAGVPEASLMACDLETPASFELVAAVATDDVMIFSNSGQGGTLPAAQAFDEAMQARRAVRNTAKDVNDGLCGTCVGVDLENGQFLDVPGARFVAMIYAFLHLHACRAASPKQVQQLLGVLQWFDLLVRPSFPSTATSTSSPCRAMIALFRCQCKLWQNWLAVSA